MTRADKRPVVVTDDDLLEFLTDEVPFGQYFDGEGTSMDDEFALVTAGNVSPNMVEDDNVPTPGSQQDAQSESERRRRVVKPTRRNKRKIINRRRNYQRHTQEQIQGMDDFFKQCPHPDEKQRMELGDQLGLDHLQVKFWFQNKRTQIKAQHERRETAKLRAENERLRAENKELKEAIPSAPCTNCGQTCGVEMPMNEAHLRLENMILREKIKHATVVTARRNIGHVPNQGSFEFEGEVNNIPCRAAHNTNVGGCQSYMYLNKLTELDRKLVTDLANSATEEVIVMARVGDPIWVRDVEDKSTVLNVQEYLRTFPKGLAQRRIGSKYEASRHTVVVPLSPQNIIEIFMELNKWVAVFSNMVSKAMLLELVWTTAEGVYDGALQLMSAEFQVLSPAVPSRDCVFVRYCKQIDAETWAVVDVSVDAILPKVLTTTCQRKPSGCIIEALPDGGSRVTWIEHVQVQDHIMYNVSSPFIKSGEGYSATRWMSVLERQCERLASAMGISDYPYFEDFSEMVLANPDGKQNILKLAERMVLSFCGSISASSGAYQWTTVTGNGVDTVRILTRQNLDDPGKPSGLLMSASICFWIPVHPRAVFDYLRNEKSRVEWDILSIGGGVKQIAYIGNGHETGNGVSILRLIGPYTDQGNMLILQESSWETTTAYVVYAPVENNSANRLFMGGNPDNIQLLPSGFSILPSGPPQPPGGRFHDANIEGTLLSIAFQILVDSDPNSKLSVASIATVNNLIESTMEKIKSAFGLYYFCN